MALYQLTLFYRNLKAHASTVRQIPADVEAIAGNNWRVLSAGEQICAIGFVSNLEHKQLQDRFAQYGSEHFHFLLIEISAIVEGYLSKDIWQWIASRPPGSK